MVEISPGLLSELSEMVVTCGEFKETVLKIFEVLLAAPHMERRTKPKLSFFDGGSFDKMFKKLEKLIDEFGGHQGDKLAQFNLTAVEDGDRKKLIKILKDYKGKKSPRKLKVVKELLQRLETRKFITYGEIKKYFFDELKPLYGKEEIYNAVSESRKEIEFWEEVSRIVSTWPDVDPLNSFMVGALLRVYNKHKNNVSKEKQKILDTILLAMESNAKRYTDRASRIEFGNKVYEDMRQMAGQINNLREVRIDDEFGKEPLKAGDFIRERSHIRNRRCAADKIFNDFWNETEDDLRKGWNEFNSKNMTSSTRNFAKSIRTYSTHYKKGSTAIDNLFQYLLKGFAIIFMTCDFYDKLTDTPSDACPKLTGGTPKEQELELKKIRDKILSQNKTVYNINEINKFIEYLKNNKIK